MSAFKDSAIKLFGKIIPLPVYCDPPLFSLHVSSLHQHHQFTSLGSSGHEEETTTTTTTSSSSGSNKKPKISSPEIESEIQTTPEKVGEEGEEKEKKLKKAEKILACPRCDSMDTKFCYYNNYNVNQPRHLCKKCQRYWTAGGSMRNVPVGAGRRKNKSSTAAHFRHIMLSESIRAAHLQASITGLQNPPYYFVPNNSTTPLTFGAHQTDIVSHKEQVRAAGQVPYSTALFNGFPHSKRQERSPSLLLLQANPAALCRSLNFQETN